MNASVTRNQRTLLTRIIAALAVLAVVALAGCSASSENSASGPATSAATDPSEPATSPVGFVPDLPVLDVTTGQEVNLADAAVPGKPTVYWAWAPYCPTCRAEAPEVQRFAQAHADEVTVVGIGTQNDAGQAREFVETTGLTTPIMLWDKSGVSWRAMGIRSQPTVVLVDADGQHVDTWIGGLPEEEILRLIGTT